MYNPNRPHFQRVSLDDPETLKRLILNGGIWRMKPFWQKAIRSIENGDVNLADCENVPPEVTAFLTKR